MPRETLGARFLAFTAALVFAGLAMVLPFAIKSKNNARPKDKKTIKAK